jgi:hypothetical protein
MLMISLWIVDNLSTLSGASVRPVITYAFFGLFIATKIIVMIKVMNAGGDWMQGVELMWDDETAGLMSAILAFWFGNRAVSKFTGKK